MQIAIDFTKDEVELLHGWQGQCSDGVGENMRWTGPYWKHLVIDKDGFTLDETVKPFKNKTEDAIKKDICRRFIQITDEGMEYAGISELYFADCKKQDDINLGERTANSIIKKLGGDVFYEETDLEELAEARKEQEREIDALMKRIDKGNLEMCDMMADLTGDESYRGNPSKLGMNPIDFYEELRKLGE
jgi:hypothetical protein